MKILKRLVSSRKVYGDTWRTVLAIGGCRATGLPLTHTHQHARGKHCACTAGSLQYYGAMSLCQVQVGRPQENPRALAAPWNEYYPQRPHLACISAKWPHAHAPPICYAQTVHGRVCAVISRSGTATVCGWPGTYWKGRSMGGMGYCTEGSHASKRPVAAQRLQGHTR